jgi:hypothetical protein
MEMTSTTAQREAAAAAPTVLTNSLSDFTPTAATTHPSTFQKSKWKDTLRAVFDGRNLGLHLLTVAVALILLANICFLGIAPNKFSNQALRDNEDYSPDHLLITTGSCDRIQNLDTGSHVVINILGMTLQSAVTSFLIVLGSPRRQHLNNAHAQGKWFDIGTPSVRNFFQLGSGRGMLWIILFLISLPLNTV